ncbi:MAG: GDP-L-fucose synthase [Okeania sp. SIO3C4]|nr:GDP-L-fucose synthase [Okeania sp. SIO3C4]
MEDNAKIYVAGGETLIGSALVRQLKARSCGNLIGEPPKEPDLTKQGIVDDFFARERPEYVFLVAGKSGGIRANQRYPAELMLDNLQVASHVIDSAYRHGVKKLLYLASSCSYPKHSPQPMSEKSLLSGYLEPTNESYAVAKIAGIKLCQAYWQQYGAKFVSGIPANFFGPGDDFSLEDSHVIPALLRKMHEAKVAGAEFVEIWGSGTPRREFVFVDDIADASICLMHNYDNCEPINISGGLDVSIRELAELIQKVVGYSGKLHFDPSKPDGMPLKALESSKLKSMGWEPQTSFEDALRITYEWFLANENNNK